MKIEVSAKKRELQGTGASRRLRNAAKVPGIVYGGNAGPMAIELDHKDLARNLSHERFHASILTLDIEGSKEAVLLRAFNMHPFKLQVQHVDFQRVSKDRKIHMKVPLHFVNAEQSQAVKEQGGVVSHVLNELNITCLPDDLPEFIDIDLSSATVGYSVHAREIKLPKGVEVLLHKKENPVVVSVLVPQLAVVEEETATAAGTPAAGEVPTSKQSDPAKDGANAADAKGGAKGGDKKDKK
ncbi:MAG: 50S ribosomal protein L25/general stress protein Ctc [Betaproteobacteria bacterium]|nr:50S ribosomal protein L25/general stress protein Ctc [Betaproteobacteria bacterium]